MIIVTTRTVSYPQCRSLVLPGLCAPLSPVLTGSLALTLTLSPPNSSPLHHILTKLRGVVTATMASEHVRSRTLQKLYVCLRTSKHRTTSSLASHTLASPINSHVLTSTTRSNTVTTNAAPAYAEPTCALCSAPADFPLDDYVSLTYSPFLHACILAPPNSAPLILG